MKVELLHIHKHFGPVHANNDITLTIPAGTIQGLLGENGAGKSTLMKILSGFIRPDAGEIRLDGQPVSFQSPADALRRGIGMLHQDPLDFPPMKVIDNFIAGSPGGMIPNKRAARQALLSLSEQFGFSLDPDAYVDSLTVGERQQLEIVRLLWLGARVLIFDEPTTGISAQQREKLFAALRRMAEEGRTVIFVTHKLEEVQALCHRVAVLRAGRLVGEAQAPYDLDKLVEMMFGKVLSLGERSQVPLGEPVLELQDLAVEDHRLRIQGVNLRLRAGEVVGLAGMEGSGQRRLLRAAAGLVRPTAGRVYLLGQDMTGKSYLHFRRAGAVYIPADRMAEGLFPDLTIAEHVALAREQTGFVIDQAQVRRWAEQAIQAFHIRGRPETPARALSGGNQQRLLLSLIPPNARVLFMEHPTRGLDMESAIWVWKHLKERCRGGAAIFFLSSDLEELMHYSDRIMVFFAGRVTRPLPVSELTLERLGQLIGGYGFDEVESTTLAEPAASA